jgi:predicted secreted acid phosphatase
MKNLFVPALVLGASLMCGCAATTKGPRSSTAQAVPAGPAANDNLNAVAWSQTAIEHDLILREVYRIAGEKLLVALKDRQWDALPREERKGPTRRLKPAVILDIDETVLDNSPYQARLVQSGGEYNEFSWPRKGGQAAAGRA